MSPAKTISLLLALGLLAFAGCRREAQDPQRRYDEARALFDQTSKNLHLPSALASGAEQQRLQNEAARSYQQLLKLYADQEYWCAKALRSLGNIRAAQTNTAAALGCWAEVVAKYPRQDWEILMALKSSADLQWEAGRTNEARTLYQRIVTQFGQTNAPAVVQTVVRGSRLKLAGRATDQ
jgi:tetratricopeptide (TPR) repeat protein